MGKTRLGCVQQHLHHFPHAEKGVPAYCLCVQQSTNADVKKNVLLGAYPKSGHPPRMLATGAKAPPGRARDSGALILHIRDIRLRLSSAGTVK